MSMADVLSYFDPKNDGALRITDVANVLRDLQLVRIRVRVRVRVRVRTLSRTRTPTPTLTRTRNRTRTRTRTLILTRTLANPNPGHAEQHIFPAGAPAEEACEGYGIKAGRAYSSKRASEARLAQARCEAG